MCRNCMKVRPEEIASRKANTFSSSLHEHNKGTKWYIKMPLVPRLAGVMQILVRVIGATKENVQPCTNIGKVLPHEFCCSFPFQMSPW